MKTTTELGAVTGPFHDEDGQPLHREAIWLERLTTPMPGGGIVEVYLRRGVVCSNDLVRDRGGVCLEPDQAEDLWRQLGRALGKES